MSTYGIEICDAGMMAAVQSGAQSRLLGVGERSGVMEWPGFTYHDGSQFRFGRAAEEAWFLHPRQVCNAFWEKLSHEPSPLNVDGRAPSFSELAFFFLRDYLTRLAAAGETPDKMVLAVPGAYLKDTATEEQRVGLLLGMAGELGLPVAGIVDMACAALCDPRSGGFNPAEPVAVVDLHLHGTDLTLFALGERLARQDYLHSPQCGFVQILKHLNASMGNRFLRQTAFDILADGHIEQAFYQQTKDFLLNGAFEFRFQINTAKRTYEMIATRDQLAADLQTFVQGIAQSTQVLVRNLARKSASCTVALTARTAAALPGLEARLRAGGFDRLLRLPMGAAACGAAGLGARRFPVVELADVPVTTGALLADLQRAEGVVWEAHLHKTTASGPRHPPTHFFVDGVGHSLGGRVAVSVGTASEGADLALPGAFAVAGDCMVRLVQEDGRWWWLGPRAPVGDASAGSETARTAVDAGDRLIVKCGGLTAELWFAHVRAGSEPRS